LDDDLERLLEDVADRTREQIMPFAEARGYLTDEDVFEDIS
jgi:hypothetical protein